MKPIDITGTVRDTFSLGIGKNKSEFGVFYGSLFFRNFEDNNWKKVASLQDITSSTKDFSWKSNTLYTVNTLIEYQNVFYKCILEHVSGVAFEFDLRDIEAKWVEIGFYGNLKLINIENRDNQDYFHKLSQYDDTVIIYGNNTIITSPFKIFLPKKTDVSLNKIFNIQNASFNKVEIYYYNNTVFANSAFGDYIVSVQFINKNNNDYDIGQWSTNFSNTRPITKIGEWKNNEAYRVNDIVRVGYFLYTCIVNHVSNISISNGFNIDYENNKWIYSGGAYAGGTYSLSDRMPINIKNTGSREIYQIDMLNAPYQGNSPESVLDLKNRRIMSNDAELGIPRNNTTTIAGLLSELTPASTFKNKSTNDILRYIYKTYRPYQNASYTSAIKFINGVPGKRYILLIKSDGGPYLFDDNIIFSGYGNFSVLALDGVTTNTGNWMSLMTNANTKKVLSNGGQIVNNGYPVEGFDLGVSKDTYRGNIFPIQSDPGKIDAFEFICLDYFSDQNIRPGSVDLFLGRYLGSYNMGDTFPLRLTPFLPSIGVPTNTEPGEEDIYYVAPSIDYMTLNQQKELFLSVGQVLDNLTIIASILKGSKDLVSLRFSYPGLVLEDRIPMPEGGEEVFNTINPFSLTSSGTIKIRALVSDGKTYVLKEANINFMYKFYWGFNANQTLTNEQILALQHSDLRVKLNEEKFVFQANPDYDVSEYIYLCYPSFYNDIGYIEDPITGFNYNIDSFEKTEINVTNEFNVETSYKIYRTKVKTFGGNFTWTVHLT